MEVGTPGGDPVTARRRARGVHRVVQAGARRPSGARSSVVARSGRMNAACRLREPSGALVVRDRRGCAFQRAARNSLERGRLARAGRRMLSTLAGCVCAACALSPDARLPELASEPLPEPPGVFAEEARPRPPHAPGMVAGLRRPGARRGRRDGARGSNFDMAGAVARVEQARVRARLADAAIRAGGRVARGGQTASTCRSTPASARSSGSWGWRTCWATGPGASPYVESALATSERNLALARLAAHRALGGAWTAPEPMTGVPLMAASLPAGGPKE